jgi:hypothetical protein
MPESISLSIKVIFTIISAADKQQDKQNYQKAIHPSTIESRSIWSRIWRRTTTKPRVPVHTNTPFPTRYLHYYHMHIPKKRQGKRGETGK